MISRPAALILLASLAGVGAVTVPRRAPEFILKSPGTDYLLSQSRGKVVLLMFMFTTCPHCQNSVQTVSGLQNEFGPRGFQAFAAAFNDLAPQLVPGFIARFRPTFPIGSTSRSTVYDFLQVDPKQQFTVPTFVFIDKKGVIRYQHMGGDFFKNEERNTRTVIEILLKEPAQQKSRTKKPATKAS